MATPMTDDELSDMLNYNPSTFKYRITFKGRESGAIGIFYPITITAIFPNRLDGQLTIKQRINHALMGFVPERYQAIAREIQRQGYESNNLIKIERI